MGVEYDIICRDCKEGAGIGGGCSKASDEMNVALTIRQLLESWAERGLEIVLRVGYQAEIEPWFFKRHAGHCLAVMGNDGRDYTEPLPGCAGLEPQSASICSGG